MSGRMTAAERRVWQNFIVLGEAVRREVGRDLWADAQLSEADFTVLAQLASAPDGTMRSTGCARALGWDTGRLSHQLRRMEERGLVRRGRGEPGDGRAAVVALTDEGRTAYRKALGPHLRSARSWFTDALDPEQLEHLDTTLQILLDHVQTKAEQTK
ncbi:MarR family winged helix-turn-helix transcriptional regulator [Actinoplanes sp. NPDC048988]|uniref:MarR family winged helix-turn-helix transcriptional regulator n=1 Tax=Actinoplanes sp. NPDC048988 TaxID=3363901 RepID=UPI00371591A7